jgi:hypothetical protein
MSIHVQEGNLYRALGDTVYVYVYDAVIKLIDGHVRIC